MTKNMGCLPIILAGLLLALGGCWVSRSDEVERTQEKTTGKISGTYDGKPVDVSLAIATKAQGQTTTEGTASLDGAAIGREIGQAVQGALRGATGATPWGDLLAQGGSAASAGLLGYLALKKRQQLKQKA